MAHTGSFPWRRAQVNPFSGEIHPPASDFVVRAEDHGIPQSRHRVIIFGLRADIAAGLDNSQISAALLSQSEFPVTVGHVLKGMPKLRSGLSNGDDSEEIWQSETSRIMRNVSKVAIGLSENDKKAFRELGQSVAAKLSAATRIHRRVGGPYADVLSSCPNDLKHRAKKHFGFKSGGRADLPSSQGLASLIGNFRDRFEFAWPTTSSVRIPSANTVR
jgi:DNA (cytosine-5)-methyltransferase 1